MHDKYKYIDVAVLESFKSLEDVDCNLLKELVETFSKTSLECLEKIEEGLRFSNCKTVWKSAHSLKSSSAALGAIALSEAAREFESLGRAEQLEEIRPKAHDLKLLQQFSIEGLQDYLENNI